MRRANELVYPCHIHDAQLVMGSLSWGAPTHLDCGCCNAAVLDGPRACADGFKSDRSSHTNGSASSRCGRAASAAPRSIASHVLGSSTAKGIVSPGGTHKFAQTTTHNCWACNHTKLLYRHVVPRECDFSCQKVVSQRSSTTRAQYPCRRRWVQR